MKCLSHCTVRACSLFLGMINDRWPGCSFGNFCCIFSFIFQLYNCGFLFDKVVYIYGIEHDSVNMDIFGGLHYMFKY